MPSPYSYFVSMLSDILDGPPNEDTSLPPRKMTLNDLDSARFAGFDDTTDLRLHQETVRRLNQSLTDAAQFPTLNQEQLRKVIAAAQLTTRERQQIVAAILATKIQAELAPRISPRRAYIAAERIYPLILESIQELEDDDEFDGQFREEPSVRGATAMATRTTFDLEYHAALAAIDRGMLAMSAVPYIHEAEEKRATTQQAYDAFTLALTKFTAHPQTSEAWSHWEQIARQGQAEAQSILS